MNKRIKKKLHKRYLVDVVYEISISSFWRNRLFTTTEPLDIGPMKHNELSNELIKTIYRYKLEYQVFVVPHSEAKGWEDWDNELVYFRFEAKADAATYAFSANNP